VLPALWIAGDACTKCSGKRKAILTAKRMLDHQTFRDVYKADNLNIDQRLKITSLTFLFTASRARRRYTNASATSRVRSGPRAFPCAAGDHLVGERRVVKGPSAMP